MWALADKGIERAAIPDRMNPDCTHVRRVMEEWPTNWKMKRKMIMTIFAGVKEFRLCSKKLHAR
jgi:hypothetical protein